jgi:anti-sigma-K factor RskA
MSGALPEDQAGLFVLGALNAEEMRAVRLAAARDTGLAAEIADWERRLAPLVRLVPEIPPPPSLWPQLEGRVSRIASGNNASGEVYQIAAQRPRLRRSRPSKALNYWRAATAGALAIAAAMGVIMINRPPPEQMRVAMILPAKPGEGGWLVQVSPKGVIKVEAQGALSRRLDQDYELWALANGSAVIKAPNLPKVSFKLLVSLEPKGGSLSGLPTGPVVYSGEFAKR